MMRTRSHFALLLAEAALIVMSILLAFAIDAAWDSRQESQKRVELLRALSADFTATSMDLDRAIDEGTTLVAMTGGYLRAARLGRDLPRDSLVFLFSGVGEATFFEPTLASYRAALSTGTIELARSAALIAALTDFDSAEGLYKLHLSVAADLYYLGPLQDLRRAGVVFDDPRFRETVSETPEFDLFIVVPPDFDLFGAAAVSAAEPLYTVQVNMLKNFEGMRLAARRVVATLDSLLP